MRSQLARVHLESTCATNCVNILAVPFITNVILEGTVKNVKISKPVSIYCSTEKRGAQIEI
jgi:hypothetical protein